MATNHDFVAISKSNHSKSGLWQSCSPGLQSYVQKCLISNQNKRNLCFTSNQIITVFDLNVKQTFYQIKSWFDLCQSLVLTLAAGALSEPMTELNANLPWANGHLHLTGVTRKAHCNCWEECVGSIKYLFRNNHLKWSSDYVRPSLLRATFMMHSLSLSLSLSCQIAVNDYDWKLNCVNWFSRHNLVKESYIHFMYVPYNHPAPFWFHVRKTHFVEPTIEKAKWCFFVSGILTFFSTAQKMRNRYLYLIIIRYRHYLACTPGRRRFSKMCGFNFGAESGRYMDQYHHRARKTNLANKWHNECAKDWIYILMHCTAGGHKRRIPKQRAARMVDATSQGNTM